MILEDFRETNFLFSEKSSKTGKLPDVRNICDDIRTRVLAGCRLVLSGVVPNNMRPEDHRFYKNAVALGAKIQDQISPYVFFSKLSMNH